jgi:hypothetical protein
MAADTGTGWNGSAGAPGNAPAGAKPAGGNHGTRNKVLIAGASVLALLALALVLLTPKLFGSTDPGCKAYAGSTLSAYNKTITDINHNSAAQVLNRDMATTIAGLNNSIAQAQSGSVKSALRSLLAELKTVQADLGSNAVPSTTMNALNNASTAADHAC